MTIAFVYQWKKNSQAVELELAVMRENGIDITAINLDAILDYHYSVSDLDFQYCMGNYKVKEGLARLREATCNYDTVIIYGTLQIPPDFIRSAWSRKFVIYWSTDDPVNSTVATLPFIGVVNHVFCQCPRYLGSQSMPDWLIGMGAKSASYLPLGYFEAWKRSRSNADILAHPKDIDISFVGSPAWRKDMLIEAKKHFGRRLKLFSHDWSPIRHFAYDFLKKGLPHVVPRAPDESHVYFRSRLSINSNACAGPSTSRTFHIPICGALQLCDFPDGLADIFDLNMHVIPYQFVNASSLCDAIESTLADQRLMEQKRIASFWHVQEKYRFANLLSQRLTELL